MKLFIYFILLLPWIIGSGEAEISGEECYSLVFDGENYVQLPHSSGIIGETPEAISVSLWVKFHEFGESAYIIGGRHGRPFDLWIGSDGRRITLRIRAIDSEGELTDYRIQHRGKELKTAVPVGTEEVDPRFLGAPDEREDVWYHFCFTYSFVEGEGKIYLDGEEIASKDGIPAVQARHFPLRFGRAQRYASLKNQQTEVRIYNRVLEKGEVRDLYEGRETADEGLAGHWKLSEGEGDKVKDSSGNEHHGELGPEDNMPRWSSEHPGLKTRN